MEPRHRLHLLIPRAVLAAAGLLWGPAAVEARVLLPQREALALAFPGGAPERRTAFLSEDQATAAQAEARAKLDSRMWTYYAGTGSDSGVTAYFETHPVRTMDETFMVVVGPDGRVKFVEVLAFSEPDDYLAPKRWLQLFHGRPLDDEMALRRGLRNITGATLTAEAIAQGVRRVLAVHRVLNPAGLAAK